MLDEQSIQQALVERLLISFAALHDGFQFVQKGK